MKRQALQHPKTKALRRELKINHRKALGLLTMFWAWTAEFCPRGDVGRFTNEDIAESCLWAEDDCETLVQALINTRFVDEHEDHRLVVHDWHHHAEEYVVKRLQREGLTFVTGPHPRLVDNGRQNPTTDDAKSGNGGLPTPPHPSPAKTQPSPRKADVGGDGKRNGKAKSAGVGSGSESSHMGGGDREGVGSGPMARTLGRTMWGLTPPTNDNGVEPSLHAVLCEVGIENRDTLRSLAVRKDLSVPLVHHHYQRLKNDPAIGNPAGALAKFLNSKRFQDSDRCKAAEAVA